MYLEMGSEHICIIIRFDGCPETDVFQRVLAMGEKRFKYSSLKSSEAHSSRKFEIKIKNVGVFIAPSEYVISCAKVCGVQLFSEVDLSMEVIHSWVLYFHCHGSGYEVVCRIFLWDI